MEALAGIVHALTDLRDRQTHRRRTAVAERSKYQQKIIKNYYNNVEAISLQRLSELVTELYLAEGKARQSTAIYTNHLWIAHGSGAELETQLELGARVNVVSEKEAAVLVSDTQEIGRMLQGLVRSLERSRENG